jgi:hypothetical protein
MLGAAGCSCCNQQQTAAPEDDWLVRSANDDMIDNAVLSQHSLYSYHFVQNSTRLNELGAHDLGVLAAHFRTAPGALNIDRGDASEELYKARIKTVTDKLALAGVENARVTITDGLPGGDGMTSRRIVAISEKQEELNQTSKTMGVGPAPTAPTKGE